MSALPNAYAWLAAEPGPKMITEALALYGTLETPGGRSNTTILDWADEIGGAAGAGAYEKWAAGFYDDDSIPWCGLFMALVALRAGKTIPDKYLSALAWSSFGVGVGRAMLGDVLVFTRSGGGHVTLYIGEDSEAYHCLGGNQSDSVCITRIAKSRSPAIRRPVYRQQPDNVRRILLAAGGAISAKED